MKTRREADGCSLHVAFGPLTNLQLILQPSQNPQRKQLVPVSVDRNIYIALSCHIALFTFTISSQGS
jgi:hypothetical protein